MKRKLTKLTNRQLTGFTLIELLVSTSIIMLLIVASLPAYERVKGRNDVRTSGQRVQNCISRAKALVTGPSSTDINLQYVDAALFLRNGTTPARCRITKRANGTSTTIEIVSLPIQLNYSLTSNKVYRFLPSNSGKAADVTPSPSVTNFYLFDSSNRCVNVRFIYETGNLLIERFGAQKNGSCT